MQQFALTSEQFSQLVGGGECFIHRHPKDPSSFLDRISLSSAMPRRTITSSPYTVASSDELILVDTTGSDVIINLPSLTNGREFQIAKVAGGNIVYVVPAALETIIGNSMGISFRNDGTSVKLKNIPNVGYILL